MNTHSLHECVFVVNLYKHNDIKTKIDFCKASVSWVVCVFGITGEVICPFMHQYYVAINSINSTNITLHGIRFTLRYYYKTANIFCIFLMLSLSLYRWFLQEQKSIISSVLLCTAFQCCL